MNFFREKSFTRDVQLRAICAKRELNGTQLEPELGTSVVQSPLIRAMRQQKAGADGSG
ncbi:hypothetical protein [Aeromonas veronii]|uniref:hypothetical protein n=1 Tax=Aeromonas veronii TaxID=654 RepID=UPI003D1A9360